MSNNYHYTGYIGENEFEINLSIPLGGDLETTITGMVLGYLQTNAATLNAEKIYQVIETVYPVN